MNIRKTRQFTILRPGGNDTALVQGIPLSLSERKQINDTLTRIYPNIEQVGFVNLDPADPELMMAGGEFCGNATRSTAWQVLKGQPREIKIKVSGVIGKLKAGVTESGEAFAEMPVYPELTRLKEDPEITGNVTVELEGITHYLDFNSQQIKGLSEMEIKAKARKRMSELGLDSNPACGIIYCEQDGPNWKIYPVVYVRDAGENGTLYYETACGSGTTALGLTLAKQKCTSVIDIPIYQPSGLPIKFSVDYDGQKFGYAQIQGPIQSLNSGTLEINQLNSYVIKKEVTIRQQLKNEVAKRSWRNPRKYMFSQNS